MVRSKLIRPLGLATLAAIALTAVMPVLEAAAGPRHHHRHHRHHGGDAFAAGVAGALFGSIIAAPRPVYAAPPAVIYVDPSTAYGPYYPVYEPPAVYYEPPAVVYQEPQVVYEPPIYVEPRSMRRPLSEYNAVRIHGRPDGPPKVITYDDAVGGRGGAEPGSQAWLDYCTSKFRSFDAETGTYLGYDGHRHFCVVK